MAKCQIAPSRGIFQVDYFWVLTKLGGRVLPKSFSPFLKKLRLTFNMRTTMRRGGQQKQMSSRKKYCTQLKPQRCTKGTMVMWWSSFKAKMRMQNILKIQAPIIKEHFLPLRPASPSLTSPHAGPSLMPRHQYRARRPIHHQGISISDHPRSPSLSIVAFFLFVLMLGGWTQVNL